MFPHTAAGQHRRFPEEAPEVRTLKKGETGAENSSPELCRPLVCPSCVAMQEHTMGGGDTPLSSRLWGIGAGDKMGCAGCGDAYAERVSWELSHEVEQNYHTTTRIMQTWTLCMVPFRMHFDTHTYTHTHMHLGTMYTHIYKHMQDRKSVV